MAGLNYRKNYDAFLLNIGSCFQDLLNSSNICYNLIKSAVDQGDNMAINEQWIPIICEGIAWVKENIGPSKKELKVRISDLEKQVQMLANGNIALINNLGLITQAILMQLKMEGCYNINFNMISLNDEKGTSCYRYTKETICGSTYNKVADNDQNIVNEFDVCKIFEGTEEEIAHSRKTRPSDRKKRYGNS